MSEVRGESTAEEVLTQWTQTHLQRQAQGLICKLNSYNPILSTKDQVKITKLCYSQNLRYSTERLFF